LAFPARWNAIVSLVEPVSTLPAPPPTEPSPVALDVAFDRASLEAMGAPIVGPTAMGKDAKRFWRLAWTLAITDFKLRFFGSALGYLWQIIRPLALFGVIYVVFSLFLAFGSGPYYPVSLLLGIVLYSFFSEVTGGSVRSLVMREPLVRKIDFPRLAVPVSVLIMALINLGLNMIPVLVFLIISGGTPMLSWLLLPFVVVAIALFAFGAAMLLSSLFVRYRDIEPIWEVILQAMFYASGIFFTFDSLSQQTLPFGLSVPQITKILLINPFAAALQEARHVFISPAYPSAAATMGGAIWLLLPIGVTVIAVILGFRVFLRTAPTIAEDL
jgi:ABC-2 type transport system permease protein